MLASIETRIAALKLDLAGLTVVTEAATGAYACTATIAALAGARRVVARARDTRRHGTARDAALATLGLAEAAGVADRIEIVESLRDDDLAGCDILTNSGHLRPITRAMIELLPRHAVIGLMFEAWEFRGTDLDLAACRERGIRVAAVNERHPDVGVFPFLGPLCVRLLADGGVTRPGSRVALLCDNPFAPFIMAGLIEAGFRPALLRSAWPPFRSPRWDAVVVALDPARNAPLDGTDFGRLAGVAGRSAPRPVLGRHRPRSGGSRGLRPCRASDGSRPGPHGNPPERTRPRADRPPPDRRAQGRRGRAARRRPELGKRRRTALTETVYLKCREKIADFLTPSTVPRAVGDLRPGDLSGALKRTSAWAVHPSRLGRVRSDNTPNG